MTSPAHDTWLNKTSLLKHMNTKSILTAFALSTLISQLSTPLHAQGSLTPPAGPPAPVMRSLTEIYNKTATVEAQNTAQNSQLATIQNTLGTVESRMAVNSLPGDATATHIIIAPGSYYFTGNLAGNPGKAGIRVEAVNVTIDLNGYNLQATAGATKGIHVTSAGGPIVIRNGFMRFWTEQAIHIPNATEFTIQDVTITNVTGKGIEAAGSGTIERVNVKYAVDYGISLNATAQSVISNCRVENITSTGVAKGIYAPKGLVSRCTVANVTGSSSTGTPATAVAGISCSQGSVESCMVRGITQQGTGPAYGIDSAALVSDSSVSQITSSASGTAASTWRCSGISACELVQRCTVQGVTAPSHYTNGIELGGQVSQCRIKTITSGTAEGATGIAANEVLDSVIELEDEGTAVLCGLASRNRIESCQNGIRFDREGGVATGNAISGCASMGISTLSDRCLITDNTIEGRDAYGIGINLPNVNFSSRVERNHIAGFAMGIWALSPGALVMRNSASSNDTNYNLHANMPIVTPATLGTNQNANISQ